MRAYSQDFRDRAISLFESGYKRKQIVEMLDIHYVSGDTITAPLKVGAGH